MHIFMNSSFANSEKKMDKLYLPARKLSICVLFSVLENGGDFIFSVIRGQAFNGRNK